MVLRKFKNDAILGIILAISMVFTFANYQEKIGTFYALLILIYLVTLALGERKLVNEMIPDKKKERTKNYFLGSGLLLGWFAIASALFYFFKAGTGGESLFSLLSQQSQISAVVGDKFAEFLIFGLQIPFIENFFFFGVILSLFTYGFKIKLKLYKPGNKNFPRMVVSCLAVGIVASFFHVTTRYLAGYGALFDLYILMDLIFFAWSALGTFITGNILAATVTHVGNNGLISLLGGS